MVDDWAMRDEGTVLSDVEDGLRGLSDILAAFSDSKLEIEPWTLRTITLCLGRMADDVAEVIREQNLSRSDSENLGDNPDLGVRTERGASVPVPGEK